jgi:hypothetical protein
LDHGVVGGDRALVPGCCERLLERSVESAAEVSPGFGDLPEQRSSSSMISA